MQTRRRSSLVATSLAVLLTSTACVDSKLTLTVLPNGSGTVQVNVHRNPAAANVWLSRIPTTNRRSAVGLLFYRTLGAFDGVSAWTEAHTAENSGGVTEHAVGYFQNVADLRVGGLGLDLAGAASSFEWSTPQNTWSDRLHWRTMAQGLGQFLLSTVPADATKDLTNSSVPAMLRGLHLEFEVVLSGPVTNCDGCTFRKERSASIVLTDRDVLGAFDFVAQYRARVNRGELTLEQASAMIDDRLSRLLPNLAVTAAAENRPDEVARFEQAFAKARVDFATSGIAEAIAAARAMNNSAPK